MAAITTAGKVTCKQGTEYNDRLYLDIKNASVTFMEDRRDGGGGGGESLF